MAAGLMAFALVFAVLALPMAILALAASGRIPIAIPNAQTERAGLALVILCFITPIIVALLRFTLA